MIIHTHISFGLVRMSLRLLLYSIMYDVQEIYMWSNHKLIFSANDNSAHTVGKKLNPLSMECSHFPPKISNPNCNTKNKLDGYSLSLHQRIPVNYQALQYFPEYADERHCIPMTRSIP